MSGDSPNAMGTIAFGRDVVVEITPTLDEYGQFRVRLLVDGKERYAGHFTDKSEES